MTQPEVISAFAALPDGPFISGGAFVCTAFPADDNARDTILSGIISFAVSLPVVVVVGNCFGLSTATDDDQLHGRTRLLTWPAKFRFTLGRLSWRWRSAAGAPPPGRLSCLKRFLASWWCTNLWVDGMVWICDHLQPCFCKPEPGMSGGDNDTADEVDTHVRLVGAAMAAWGADEARERHFGLVTANFKRAGFVLLNLIWGVR
jgi:hypothetical protein